MHDKTEENGLQLQKNASDGLRRRAGLGGDGPPLLPMAMKMAAMKMPSMEIIKKPKIKMPYTASSRKVQLGDLY